MRARGARGSVRSGVWTGCGLSTTDPKDVTWGRRSRHGRLPELPVEGDGLKLKLDLHPIYNRGGEIDKALRGVIDEAIRKKATEVEIIPGKGSGQLKKKVLRFLEQKEIKALYHRIDKDAKNHGRLFVYFRYK